MEMNRRENIVYKMALMMQQLDDLTPDVGMGSTFLEFLKDAKEQLEYHEVNVDNLYAHYLEQIGANR